MISFIWLTTESMKFSDIKSIKMLFESQLNMYASWNV